MPENELNKTRIIKLYHQAKCEIIENFDSFTATQAQNPDFFFSQKHKLNTSLSIIDTIVNNLTAHLN